MMVRIIKQHYANVPVGTIGEVMLYSPGTGNPYPYEIKVPGIRQWLPMKEEEVKVIK
jgi:hypothetical protein